jgi:hypothetical protein
MKMKRVILVLLLLSGVVFAYQVFLTQGNPQGGSQGKIPENAANLGPIVPVEDTSIVIHLNKCVYSPEDTLILTVANHQNSTLRTGYGFRLYRRENGGWVEVQLNLVFPAVVVEVGPGKSWEQKIDLSKLNLESGSYRIEKQVCSEGVCIYEHAEFEVRGRGR